MLEFIITVSALVIISLLFFAPTLFRTNHLPAENYDQRNTQIARERLDELKQSLDSGELSQSEFDGLKQELEKNLAIDLSAELQIQQDVENSSKPVALILMVIVPVVAVLIYMQLGQPDAIDGQASMQAQTAGPSDAQPKISMQEAVVKLADRLKEKPDDPQGWFMLARTYMVMERYDEAVKAYEKTLRLVDEDADLLVRYADALAMSNNGVLAGKPRDAIEKALSINPQHQQGLWLAGVAAIEVKQFKQALTHFLVLQPMLASNAEALSQLHQMIARTEQNLSEADIKSVQTSLPATAVVAPVDQLGKAEIQVTVSLDDALKDKVSDQDVVFIYAKAMSGSPMPLAAVRKTVASLPITVTLNDAMAMMPAMKLSSFDKVKIGAKISKSGVAGLAAGDLFAEITNIDVKSAAQVSVAINKIRQ